MDSLAREICQNSLDARRRDLPADEPVRVEFRLVEIRKDDHHDVFGGYEEALRGAHEYWKGRDNGANEVDFIEQAQEPLRHDTVPVLVMGDYGTTGLVGSEDNTGFWSALVNTEGVSGKQDESSGGSFGIGKNAPFAYTSLNLVFYNTFATDGARALQGVTHLVTTQLERDGKPVKASDTGKFLCMLDDYDYRPIQPGDECSLFDSDLFNRNEYGTDVAVFGFKTEQYGDWERQIAIALLKNFLLAIKDGNLVAEVSSDRARYVVDKEHLEPMLFEEFAGEHDLTDTRQAYETVVRALRPDDKTALHFDKKIKEEDDLSIYIRYDDECEKRLSRYRSAGMLINTDDKWVRPHFCAVVVVNDVGTGKLNKLLRDAEPPQHNEWRGRNATEPSRQGQVTRALREIRRRIEMLMNVFDLAMSRDFIDAGIGSYLPDSSEQPGPDGEGDELRTGLEITEIAKASPTGRKIVTYESGADATGTRADIAAHKQGKPKRRRKKSDERIPTVNPGSGEDSGAAPGEGELGVATVPDITSHRIFRVADGTYRLHVDSGKDYENVYISYRAGQEDGNSKKLEIWTYQQSGQPPVRGVTDQMGPVHIHRGANDFTIDFIDRDALALIPDFRLGRTR